MRFRDVNEVTEVTEKTAVETEKTAVETEVYNLPDEIDDNWLIEHGWAEVSPSKEVDEC